MKSKINLKPGKVVDRGWQKTVYNETSKGTEWKRENPYKNNSVGNKICNVTTMSQRKEGRGKSKL